MGCYSSGLIVSWQRETVFYNTPVPAALAWGLPLLLTPLILQGTQTRMQSSSHNLTVTVHNAALQP